MPTLPPTLRAPAPLLAQALAARGGEPGTGGFGYRSLRWRPAGERAAQGPAFRRGHDRFQEDLSGPPAR